MDLRIFPEALLHISESHRPWKEPPLGGPAWTVTETYSRNPANAFCTRSLVVYIIGIAPVWSSLHCSSTNVEILIPSTPVKTTFATTLLQKALDTSQQRYSQTRSHYKAPYWPIESAYVLATVTRRPVDSSPTNKPLQKLCPMQKPISPPKGHYCPYSGAEPITDCWWICCLCMRLWWTSQLGDFCVGCSHRYDIRCCALAG